ncbi:hypothetical protein MYAM1_001379 [Malassezia yamatoensis]|uniref:Actin-related protein n=1 Tax=Malassezia yamatoensis TaxID=253288 RepID=A0AAJ5YT10_9BASI|nr:hypothetical protein MYAM1_001379 [Malassezia yamatoensis]
MTREASTLLIVHDAQRVFAGLGIQDPFGAPDIIVSARVGKKNDGTYLVGSSLTDAEADGEQLHIRYAIENGQIEDWQALKALWNSILKQFDIDPAQNSYFTMIGLPMPLPREAAERTAQIFFEEFNTPALSIGEVPLLTAYAIGVLNALVIDIGAEETSAVAVSDCAVLPTTAVLSKLGSTHCTWWLAYLLTQDTAVTTALRPLVQADLNMSKLAFGLAQVLVAEQQVRIDVSSDLPGMNEPDTEKASFNVAAALVEGRERDIVGQREHNASQDHATEDVIHVQFRGVQVPVGRTRNRFHEPLLRPQLLERIKLDMPAPPAVMQALYARQVGGEPICISVPAAIGMAARKVQPLERRVLLWENVVISGSMTRFQGLVPELLQALTSYMINEQTETAQVAGEPNTQQPRNVRALKVPEYFPAFKDHPDLLPYLGANIYAKLVFNDMSGRNYISKLQYNDGGPSVAFAIGSG